MISPYCIFEVDKLSHDGILLILNINHILNIIYPSTVKHVQSHIPNNNKVINKNRMSCNTLCPCISSVWEQYSKILYSIHFDTTTHFVSLLYEKCHSGSVVTLFG